MIRVCAYCGKEFEAYGTAKYCSGPHYAICEVCGKEFEVDPRNLRETCSKACQIQLRKQHIQAKPRICELCGKTFYSTSNTARYCSGPHYKPCSVCGKSIEITDPAYPPHCCSMECTIEFRKRTCREQWGVDNTSQLPEVKAKLRKTIQANRDKYKQRTLEKYGVEFNSQRPEVRAKISKTISSPEWQQKFKQRNQQVWGTDYPMQSTECKQRYSDAIQTKYGVPWYVMSQDCREAGGHIISRLNREFGKRLSDIGLTYKFETKLDEFSYDLEIENKHILLELDPTYTHNTIGNHWGKSVSPDYHLQKSKIAEDNGYRCIHVFDWDNIDKILMLLIPKSRIFARNCTVEQIPATQASEFERSYHLQGSVHKQEYCYGLYYQGSLIQVMTFGKPRYRKNVQYELLRLCTLPEYSVIGGASKLFSRFISDVSPKSIISYCDLAKFTGSIYTTLGLVAESSTQPARIWSQGSRRITDNLLRQRGFDQLFGTSYGKGTSNEQLMLDHGWLPVYDCGQGVYVYTA